jgi:hypothetical protein
MIQIYVLAKHNGDYKKGFYARIEPIKIESITIHDISYSKDRPLYVINVNLPHYSYQLMNEKTNEYYWNSYDDACEYLKKIGLYDI